MSGRFREYASTNRPTGYAIFSIVSLPAAEGEEVNYSNGLDHYYDHHKPKR